MKNFIYSVHDDKTSFCAPFMDCSDASAVRGVSLALGANTGLMSFAPTDFRLYRIGSFDTESGLITAEFPPVLVCEVASLVKDKEVFNEE